MAQTDKVLGTISAINTFLENFPMSILDMMHGKVYTSVFDFIVDILAACGVDINEIISFLLEKIYGLEETVKGGITNFYESLQNGSLQIDDQNDFLEGLEYSIKGILMSLLSSIFTCSALPVLPNKMFDGPYRAFYEKEVEPLLLHALENDLFPHFVLNKHLIDPMGILDISPSSRDGRMFYVTGAKDVFYQKEHISETTYNVEWHSAVTESDKVIVTSETPLYQKQVALYIKKTHTAINKGDADGNDFFIDSPVESDIKITIQYEAPGQKDEGIITWDGTIKKGDTKTETSWNASPTDKYNGGRPCIIKTISINDGGTQMDIGNETWLYLDKEKTQDFLDVWNNNGFDSIPWGEKNEEKTIETETIHVFENQVYSTSTPTTIYKYVYKEYNGKDLNLYNSERVDFVPVNGVDKNSPDKIVCYEGLNPNELYKTYDMNAFLWYVLHKGMKRPQVEYNHMMWDSRVSAAKKELNFKSASEWNAWYASKIDSSSEFKYFDSNVDETTPIYPIMQLESEGSAKNLFRIRIPSQRYFYPKVRLNHINNTKAPKMPFNASMYKYNWDYLNNITILKPKLMLVGLCEYLLGFTLSQASSLNVNMVTKMIEAKLSQAIKTTIEANDMEVENCYTEFSNDDVNMMLEEMLQSRYTATQTGGDTETVRTHDVQQYISMLDQTNTNASPEGNVTQIKKLVTEVTASSGNEASTDYGFEFGYDANILKKLLQAIIMPILTSLFTPQVLLIIYMNFGLMGVVKLSDVYNQDFTLILNMLMNKIFGLVKSIILFIKDKIIELLLNLLYEKLLPLLLKYQALLLLEKITCWLVILQAALACLPIFKFKREKIIGSIDEVDYADIIPSQDTPESSTSC